MISIQRLRSFFLTLSLTVLLVTSIGFGFKSADSWAATPLTQNISQPQTQIAALNQAEKLIKNIDGKAQEAIGNITGDPQNQAAEKAKELKAKTLEGMENSIENPNYQPGGINKPADKQALEATEDIKAEARDALR